MNAKAEAWEAVIAFCAGWVAASLVGNWHLNPVAMLVCAAALWCLISVQWAKRSTE